MLPPGGYGLWRVLGGGAGLPPVDGPAGPLGGRGGARGARAFRPRGHPRRQRHTPRAGPHTDT